MPVRTLRPRLLDISARGSIYIRGVLLEHVAEAKGNERAKKTEFGCAFLVCACVVSFCRRVIAEEAVAPLF